MTVEVEVDLGDFNLDDLIEELEDRLSYKGNKMAIEKFCKETLCIKDFPKETLEDVLKLDLLKEALKKYSLTELEEKLK